ncbi:LysR substrate-binding domain-containing protein [Pseudomonas putida]|uniref:LysR substrate-binding domain-containing protein n=1 Tax=Pseudomonas putida TaxID=303 RepID=UPI0021565718|nr:LysR substrate-binding domain-containing protein [Pseudomonas putida]
MRVGERADNPLVARKLCDHLRILCASPAYLARQGELLDPQQLSGDNCLIFSGLCSFHEWRLNSGKRK